MHFSYSSYQDTVPCDWILSDDLSIFYYGEHPAWCCRSSDDIDCGILPLREEDLFANKTRFEGQTVFCEDFFSIDLLCFMPATSAVAEIIN